MAEGRQRVRAFNQLRSFATCFARAGATARCGLSPLPHAFSLHAHGTLRIPDADRALVFNELERLQLLSDRCRTLSGIKHAQDPAQAAKLALHVASSVWIHDHIRDAFLWRALLWEQPAAAAGLLRFSVLSKHYVTMVGVDWIDRGCMLPKRVHKWMEALYDAHVSSAAARLCAKFDGWPKRNQKVSS
jgi:hypothetical protein